MRNFRNIGLVMALVLVLGCGGGGGTTQVDEEMPPVVEMPDPAKECEAAGNVYASGQCITPCEAGGGALNEHGSCISESQQEAQRKAQEEADMKARIAFAKDMYAALDGSPAQNGFPRVPYPLVNGLGTLTIDTKKLNYTLEFAAQGIGAFPVDADLPDPVDLDIGDSVGSFDGWNGFRYSHTDPKTGVVNEALVYNNKGPGKSEYFADTDHVIAPATTGGHIKGYVTIDLSGDAAAIAKTLALVRADNFNHSGTQTHQPADRFDAVYIRGTYDGFPGEYRCKTGCSSTNDSKDGPSALTGNWHFKPDLGAMAHMPDQDFLYFGWWVRNDGDGKPTIANAFFREAGSITVPPRAGSTDMAGKVTYVGKAVGLFSLTNTLGNNDNGGHFTADAELTATFGDASETANPRTPDAGITGTIDNFRLNDGTEDPGWSVKLIHRGWSGLNGRTSFGYDRDEPLKTAWTINGVKAADSGIWRATTYDEKPGNPPVGDGSNVPTSMSGIFYTEYSTRGRLAGAFGANKVD